MKKILFVAIAAAVSLCQDARAQQMRHNDKSWAYETCKKLQPATAAALGLAKSAAKTTAPLRLKATALYDVSSSTVTDSALYTYSGLRGMGVDDRRSFDAALHLYDDGMGLDSGSKAIQTFNSSDSLLSTTVMLRYAGLWENFYKISYTRDAANQVIAEEGLFWDDSIADWYRIYAVDYVWNSAGQLISMTAASYDWTGALVDSSRGVATYNAAGNPLSSTVEKWSMDDGTWSNYLQVTNTYDAAGMLLQNMITQNWADIAWENEEKESYTYDGSGRIVSDLSAEWNADSSDWQDFAETISKYDVVSGRVGYELNRSWDMSGVCDTLSRFQYEYNGNKLISTIESSGWDTSSHSFVVSTIEFYYYNDYGMGIANVAGNKAVISVFPSPASDVVNVHIAWEHTQAASMELYDIQGRVWKQWTLPAGNAYTDRISVKELPSGAYFIKVNSDGHTPSLQRFAVQH